ncbi:MAG: MerR family transcriptional regulator [Alteromonadaceae bacterium]|nr:MerR family transcriptional regulator [Alteromonadaceae bacterium]
MRMDKLIELTGVPRDTLRYYEKIGLITKPPRLANGYRDYPQTILNEIKFIKLAQSVGFTLNEIKPAIPFVNDPQPGCPKLHAAITEKIDAIDARIAELQSAKEKLGRQLARNKLLVEANQFELSE